MSAFHLTIQTPEAVAFDQDVEAIVVPGLRGQFGVLAHHAPLRAAVEKGILKVTASAQELYFAVGAGFADVRRDGVHLIVDAALPAANEFEASEKLRAYAKSVALPPRVTADSPL